MSAPLGPKHFTLTQRSPICKAAELYTRILFMQFTHSHKILIECTKCTKA